MLRAYAKNLTTWFETHAQPIPTPQTPIVAAVSGGADSMALALLLKTAFGAPAIRCVTMDHGLRHGSHAEARWTTQQLQARGLEVVLRRLDFHGMEGNMQALARLERYKAAADFAFGEHSGVIATAHSLEDQAETVFARLGRASGTKGLSAMRPVCTVPGIERGQCMLIRPLLAVARADLRALLQEVGQRWLEDPSNRRTKFDRVRLRALVEHWRSAGFEPARIASSADHLARSEDALRFYTQCAFDRDVTHLPNGDLSLEKETLAALPADIQLRLLRAMLQVVSQRHTQLRFEKLERALAQLLSETRAIFTLHYSKISLKDGQILIQPEVPK